MTFKEKYLAGEIEFEAIDDFIEEWNNSDAPETLAKFLGLNEEEDDEWIEESDEAIKELLDRR
jgi:flavodoxin